MTNDVIQLFTKGEVHSQDKTFTRLVGGFGEDSVVISDLQIAELLGYKKGARAVRQRIVENIKHFEEGLHIIVLNNNDIDSQTKNILYKLGYSKQSVTQVKCIYLFSQEGFNLYLQLSDSKEDLSNFERLYFGNSLNLYVNPMRYEKSFGLLLKESLNGIIKFTEQYPVCNNKYRIDFYSKEFNLAIEYDEIHHVFFEFEDKVRQKEISKDLNCTFIRVKKNEELKGLNEIIKHLNNNTYTKLVNY